LERSEINTTPDTHIYRVRKAEKIRKYIKINGLESHLMVPKKFLLEASDGKYIVAAKKVVLSVEVASVSDIEFQKDIRSCGLILGGQARAFTVGAKERDLTPIQAKALAELAFLGYTDQSYNNLFFTKNGKVAILDTEPVKRVLKKSMSSKLWIILIDKHILRAYQGITATAKLKMYCKDPEALTEVKRIERNHVLWNAALIIGKIALCCLALYFTPIMVASLNLQALAATTLKVSILALATIKTLTLTLNLRCLYQFWKWSCEGRSGLQKIVSLELEGLL
jgi:hypothetical protein